MAAACLSNHPSSSQMKQSIVTCIYQTRLCDSPTHLTLTWSKTRYCHSLTIHAPDWFSFTIPLHPSTFSFFRTRHGSKSIYLTHRHFKKIKLHWDFTRAEFTQNSAEPETGFYVAITSNGRLEYFVGDRLEELIRRAGVVRSSAESTLLSRREHVFGRRSYETRATFMGSKHVLGIECGGGVLKVIVDGEIKIVVKRLAWKFRGNEKISVGGVEIEFYWDVFNWINRKNSDGKKCDGYGMFVFQIGDGGVIWPEMVGPEKRLMRKSLSAATASPAVTLSPSPSCSSVMQWAEETSDGGRSSCSSSNRSCASGGAFTLLLYAWRKD